ncbi:MAG: hypothetical protein ILP17_05160, partial [Lachnospiraceae bacterium]|nr:hypothetical protein [Lachnospiraceae bacterium]
MELTTALRKTIQWKYEAEVNKRLRKLRKPLEKFLKEYDVSEIENIYYKMAEPKKRLVVPVIETEETFLEKWRNVSYDPMPIDNDTRFYSCCGVRV